MPQYGDGLMVYRTGRSQSGSRAIHADRECRYLHAANRSASKSLMEKPLPSVRSWIEDGRIDVCGECWPGSEAAARVDVGAGGDS